MTNSVRDMLDWFLLALIWCLLGWLDANGSSHPFQHYSPTNRVRNDLSPQYQRDAYAWYVHNEQVPSNLYSNGVWLYSESCSYQTGLADAWAVRDMSTVKVAVVDNFSDMPDVPHGLTVQGVVGYICGGEVGKFEASPQWATNFARAMQDALAWGAKVINCSWVCWEKDPHDVGQLREACEAATAADCLIVCGVDNNPRNYDEQHSWGLFTNYPAFFGLSNVLVVGSLDMQGHRYWSAYSTNWVHLGAPGRVILCTNETGQWVYASGASYATAIVSSCAALARSQFPSLSAVAIKDWMLANVKTSPEHATNYSSGGILNMSGVLDSEFLLKLCGRTITIHPGPGAMSLERSMNMQDWSHVCMVSNLEFVVEPEGFYRVVAR